MAVASSNRCGALVSISALSVIASEAILPLRGEMDCFASLAMTCLPSHAVSACRFALPQCRWCARMNRHVPYFFGIFANGAVGGKPRHPRHIEDGGARPGRNDLPARVDAALGFVVGIEV